MESTKYFVYLFLDPRKPGHFIYDNYEFKNEPFYVGKGHGYRIEKHFNHYIKNESNQTLKYRKLRKILNEGFEPIIVKLYIDLTEELAFSREKDLIKKIGRIDKKSGPLSNHTNGGEGCSGRILSDETKKKISNSISGINHPLWQTKASIETIIKKSKTVYQYNTNGLLINTWVSSAEASRQL